MIDFSHTLKESFGQGDARLSGRTGMCGVPRPTGSSDQLKHKKHTDEISKIFRVGISVALYNDHGLHV